MRFKMTSLLGNVLWVGVLLSAFAMNAAGASAQTVGARPCDVIGSTTPCVAAISTTRALYQGYQGALYEVTRASDKKVALRRGCEAIIARRRSAGTVVTAPAAAMRSGRYLAG